MHELAASLEPFVVAAYAFATGAHELSRRLAGGLAWVICTLNIHAMHNVQIARRGAEIAERFRGTATHSPGPPFNAAVDVRRPRRYAAPNARAIPGPRAREPRDIPAGPPGKRIPAATGTAHDGR